MKTTKLIGLHGRAGSGKDTVFSIMEDTVKDYTFKRDAFADRLKLSAIRNFKPDCTIEDAYDICEVLKSDGFVMLHRDSYDTNPIAITGREFLQHYGTEAHRQVFTDDFWVDAVLPDLEDKYSFGREDVEEWDILVVTDVRFPNEAEAIRKVGGVIWQIYRPQPDESYNKHSSEKPLDSNLIDWIVLNDGDLDQLKDQVGRAWDKTLRGPFCLA